MKNSGTAISKFPKRIQDQIAAKLYPETTDSLPGTGPSAGDLAQVGTLTAPLADRGLIKGISGGVYPFMLWLDYHIPSLNTVLGFKPWAIVKRKQVAKDALHAALQYLGKYPQNPKGRMHVLLTSYVLKPRDTDNPIPKFLIDELRYCGLLRNDDPGSMFHTMNPEVRVSKRKLCGTKIIITQALP